MWYIRCTSLFGFVTNPLTSTIASIFIILPRVSMAITITSLSTLTLAPRRFLLGNAMIHFDTSRWAAEERERIGRRPSTAPTTRSLNSGGPPLLLLFPRVPPELPQRVQRSRHIPYSDDGSEVNNHHLGVKLLGTLSILPHRGCASLFAPMGGLAACVL